MYPWSEIFRHWLYSLVSRVLWRCIALDCESMFGSILSWESCETCVKGDGGSPVRISCNLRMSHWCCQPVAMLTSLRTIQVMSIWAPNLCESRSVDMSFQGEFFFLLRVLTRRSVLIHFFGVCSLLRPLAAWRILCSLYSLSWTQGLVWFPLCGHSRNQLEV